MSEYPDATGHSEDDGIPKDLFPNADETLMQAILTVPHHCGSAKCLGHINQQKLKMFSEILTSLSTYFTLACLLKDGYKVEDIPPREGIEALITKAQALLEGRL